jgi:hypothetical protein
MAHVHFDNTEDETQLVHDCEPGTCPRCGRGHSAVAVARGPRCAQPGRTPRPSERTARSSIPSTRKWPTASGGHESLRRPNWSSAVDAPSSGSRSVTAGTGPWTPMPASAPTWARTAPSASGTATTPAKPSATSPAESSHRRERQHPGAPHLRPPLRPRARPVGAAPETAIGDKGLSIQSAFKKCTTHGTAAVVPRRRTADGVRHDKDTHDRHGIPRCKHCGAPTTFVRFSPRRPQPSR